MGNYREVYRKFIESDLFEEGYKDKLVGEQIKIED